MDKSKPPAENKGAEARMCTGWDPDVLGDESSCKANPYNPNEAKGSEFGASDWKSNHTKIGICDSPNDKTVVTTGFNMSYSQLNRGSVFVHIESEKMANSLRKLLPMPD